MVSISGTLTTHGVMTPNAWRDAWKRFRMRAVRAGVPLVYRVELQKRKTPHVHVVAWIDQANPKHLQLFTRGWLECIDEQDDPDSARYAVEVRQIANEGWLVYLALHHGKQKREQLGWVGKQWGVVCQNRFRERQAKEFAINDVQRFRIQRVMRRLLAVPRGPTRSELEALKAFPGLAWTGKKVVTRVLPSGSSWLRCASGPVVERVVAWATAFED